MTIKYITDRIREYYCADVKKDEWLVEKGKVKEGRMLKEACIEIERLQKRVSDQESKLSQKWLKGYEHDKSLTDPLDHEIRKLKSMNNTLTSILRSIKGSMSNFEEEK